MKFEDMKKIWDEQNQTHLYVIDEKLLNENIQAKKKGASRFINKMEWFIIMANLFAGSVVIIASFLKGAGNIYAYLTGLVMIGLGIYVVFRRWHRLRNENRFDRTMLGDLEHAISNATYRAQLSYSLLIYWIIFGAFFIITFVYEDKSLLQIILAAAFCVIIWFLGRWEHRKWHLASRKRLEAMKEKLLESV